MVNILWMGQRNPNHQLIDGKHPIVGVNHPKLVVQDFAGPSTVWFTNLGARMRRNSPQAEIIRTELFHIPLVSDISIICQLCFNYSIIPVVIFYNLNPSKLLDVSWNYRYIYIFHVNDTWYHPNFFHHIPYFIFHIPVTICHIPYISIKSLKSIQIPQFHC